MKKVTKAQASHIVARVSGVTENDTRLEAARKALALMKSVGMPPAAIRKAERIVAEIELKDAKKRRCRLCAAGERHLSCGR